MNPFGFEAVAEADFGPVEEDAEIGDGDFEHLADLVGFELFDFAEEEGFALTGGEALEAGADEFTGFLGEEEAFDVFGAAGPVAAIVEAGIVFGFDGVQLGFALGGAAAGQGLAMENAEEPGLELGAAGKVVELFEEGGEDFLDEVFGNGLRKAKAAGGAVEDAGVVGDGLGDGGGVSLAEFGEKVWGDGGRVVHASGCGIGLMVADLPARDGERRRSR